MPGVRRLVAILAAAGLLVAGCGGGSSNKGTTTTGPSGPPLTKAAYQAKLKQIASEISNEIGKTSSSGKNISKEDVDKLVKAFHEFAARLAAVNPPAAVEQIHADLVKTMNDLGDELSRHRETAELVGEGPLRRDHHALRREGDPGADQGRERLQGQGLQTRPESLVFCSQASGRFTLVP